MIAVSLNVGGGVRLIKPAKLHVHVNYYKHAGVCGNGSVPLGHSGNIVTRIGIHIIHTVITLISIVLSLSGHAIVEGNNLASPERVCFQGEQISAFGEDSVGSIKCTNVVHVVCRITSVYLCIYKICYEMKKSP